MYAEKAVTFKYTAVVEGADGEDGDESEDGDDQSEDSAFAYSVAGAVLATAALAF